MLRKIMVLFLTIKELEFRKEKEIELLSICNQVDILDDLKLDLPTRQFG